MSLFLKKFCILESIDQVEFFFLHAGHFHLVQLLLIVFAVKLLFNHVACFVLLFNELLLPFSLCFSLLYLNHHFDVLRFFFFLLSE